MNESPDVIYVTFGLLLFALVISELVLKKNKRDEE